MSELDVESIDELFEKHNKRTEILEKIAEAAIGIGRIMTPLGVCVYCHYLDAPHRFDCPWQRIQDLKKELESG